MTERDGLKVSQASIYPYPSGVALHSPRQFGGSPIDDFRRSCYVISIANSR